MYIIRLKPDSIDPKSKYLTNSITKRCWESHLGNIRQFEVKEEAEKWAEDYLQKFLARDSSIEVIELDEAKAYEVLES